MKKTTLLALYMGMTLLSPVLAGCGGSSSVTGSEPLSRSIDLVPYRDPLTMGRPRFMDIDDRPFSDAFAASFAYNAAQVTLFYDPAPSTPWFVGKIVARGLKPNFAYQLKLVGKPQFGSRGWGSAGSDFSNEAIGRAARWWNDESQSNTKDSDFEANYKKAPDARKQSIYGYLFMGDFVTDKNGDARREFFGSKSYHITWQDKQNVLMKNVVAGTYRIGSSDAPYWGYGKKTPPIEVKLWYEYESGRSRDVKLPVGNYNCRLLITEETFHSTRPNDKGGSWPTVFATEDFGSDGQPDTNPDNDVRFRIG